MKCTECGSELKIGHIFCGKCGAASPQLPAEFEALERSYLELRKSYQKGELEEGDFLSRLEEMVIEDENGNYWMLGVESGEWHRYDGQQWVREDPGIRKKEEPGEVITSAPTDVPRKT